ncbi:tRNA-splicing endonuclease subunit Sen54-like [Mya arenaria]|uniref:tRNA-splicing endonuclease subunit Sen54-like n=1 Tax=Mya arenaria TaxID=6604 RepID=UPI0022DEF805|nr:tRNA-splicing endonuclease subunit Sen54-like [Mya arenaria]
MLSADELFKYKQGLEKTVPEKGGTKDFNPDGSWIQNKQIEKFHEERERVLQEPRVHKKQDLAVGEWNADLNLVELRKEMRNFWQVMGFTNTARKWLHPEEALFLIETNVLQVLHEGLPLSMQEAWQLLLGNTVTMEFYQVYTHLRRIGYVVLRHQGRISTKYERQIGIDKPRQQQNRKKTKKVKTRDEMNNKVSRNKDKGEERGYTLDTASDKVAMDTGSTLPIETETDSAGTQNTSDIIETGSDCVNGSQERNEMQRDKTEKLDISLQWMKPPTFSNTDLKYHQSVWDFRKIYLPDFGCTSEKITVKKPDVLFTPGQVDVEREEYVFNRADCINKKKRKRKDMEEDQQQIRKLQFSRPDVMSLDFKWKHHFKTWSEYKNFFNGSWRQNRVKDFQELVDGDLQPLVKPDQATSTLAVLEQLQIVKEEKLLLRDPDRKMVMPEFDVYLPKTSYSKSMPGIPDFRILICRPNDCPPSLRVTKDISTYLDDDVPLQCAVVDSGSICSYTVSDISLPLDIHVG